MWDDNVRGWCFSVLGGGGLRLVQQKIHCRNFQGAGGCAAAGRGGGGLVHTGDQLLL